MVLMTISAGCASVGLPRIEGAGRSPNSPTLPSDSAWRLAIDGRSTAARAAFDAKLAGRGGHSDASLLFGRALLAHDSGDWKQATDLWLEILSLRSSDPAWPAIAELAAHKLEALVGEVSGQTRLAAQLAAIHDERLPFEARRRLILLRAAYVRRLGREEEAVALESRAGCPVSWQLSPLYGSLPHLDLAREFAPDTLLPVPDAAATRIEWTARMTRGCRLSIEGGRARSGVIYASTFVHTSRAQRVVWTVENDDPYRLFIDGNEVWKEIEERRFPSHVRNIQVTLPAGWHRFVIKMAAPQGRVQLDSGIFGETPLEIAGDIPASGQKSAASANRSKLAKLAKPAKLVAQALTWSRAPQGGILARFLDAHGAYRAGDSIVAEGESEKLVEVAPKFGAGLLLAAQIAADDVTRPASVARDRARRIYEHALAVDPALERARYNLAGMDLELDHPREAIERLAEAKGTTHGNWRFPFARYQALRMRGWNEEAEHALAEALTLNPEACPAISAQASLKRERHDFARAVALAKEASRCAGGSGELADLLRSAGDLDGAVAEYERLIARDRTREGFWSGLGETLAEMGRVDRAASVFEGLAHRHPRTATYRLQLADALITLGRSVDARRALVSGLAETPESQEIARALKALCGGDCPGTIDPFRVDGKKVIADFEKAAAANAAKRSGAPAMLVLDRTVTRVFPTGARLTLTHNIIKVLAKDGIDKWGEVQIPEGAEVLTLRTVKADGTTREPEEITEKQTISAPDLEVGDFVEFEYVDPAAAAGAFPDGFLAERFYFRSYDAPLDRTEYVVVAPETMSLQIDRRGDAPSAQQSRADGLQIWIWGGRKMAQLFPEPAATPFAEYVPSVRVGSGISRDRWRDYLRDQQFGTLRANAQLISFAKEITRGAHSDDEKMRALDDWVRKHIRHGGSIELPATLTLAKEEGNRITLLASLLQAIDIPSEILLARSQKAARLDGALPDLESFDQALLKVGDRFVDPRFRHSAMGLLSPPLRGAEAFSLGGSSALVTLPSQSDDRRAMRLEISLSADGGADVVAHEHLTGWPALEWREGIEKLTQDRLRPEFEQHTLGYFFPGSSLIDLTWQNQDQDDRPFELTYRFHSPHLARRDRGCLLFGAPFPSLLEKRYVGVAVRKTPLDVEYTAPTRIEAQVKTPSGLQLKLGAPVSLSGFGTLSQSLSRTPDGFAFDAKFEMPAGRVEPARYADFERFAVEVDRAEARAAEVCAK